MIKKILLYLIGFLAFTTSGHSQELLDSLKSRYQDNIGNNKQRYSAAGQYINALFFNDQRELAQEVFKENIALALKEKDSKYAASLYAINAMNQRLLDNLLESNQSIELANSYANKTLDHQAKGYVAYATGWLQVRDKQEAQGVRSFIQAIEHYDRAPYSNTVQGKKATVYGELAAIYANWQEYDLQEKYSLLAMESAKEQGDATGIFNAYMSMGHMYEVQLYQNPSDLRLRDLAESYYLMASELYNLNTGQMTYASNLSFVAINLASLYLGAFPESYQDKVKHYANIALKVAKQTNHPSHIASAYGILAEIELSENQLQRAKEYLELSLEAISKSNLGDLHIELNVLQGLAEISEAQENYAQGLEYQKRYLETFKSLYKQDQLALSKQIEAQYDKRLQEREISKMSLQMQDKEHQISLMHAHGLQQKQAYENLKLRQENQAKELELQELEIQRSNQELKLAQLESKARVEDIVNYKKEISYKEKLSSYYIWLIYIFIFVVALLSYAFWQRVRVMRKSKKLYQSTLAQQQKDAEISTLKAMLEGQESERARIARDLHDGLGGALSSTKIGLSTLRDQVSPELVGEFQKNLHQLDNAVDELRRIAHNLMPDLLQRYGLSVALMDYATRMSREDLQVDVQFLHFTNSLDKDKELIVYRIIQELTNNAIKHARASYILIQLVQDKDAYHLTIEDDGVGFQVDKVKQSTSAGMHNIASRVDFLKGTLQVHSEKGVGTSIEITF